MSKYKITIQERVPTPTPPLLRQIKSAPAYFLVDVLELDTDKNLVAKIATLVEDPTPTKERNGNT